MPELFSFVSSISLSEIIGLLIRCAEVIALCVISIPKLTEIYLKKTIDKKLETYKKNLTIELEDHKAKLQTTLQMALEELKTENTKKLEAYKHELQKASVKRNEKSLHLNDIANKLKSNLYDCLESTERAPSNPYTYVKHFLDIAFSLILPEMTKCHGLLQKIDEECEKPGAMANEDYAETIRDLLLELARSIDSDIVKIKEEA